MQKITLQSIERIFKDIFANERITVTEETTAEDIEEWDSLRHITLLVSLEETYNVKFNLGEIQQLKNVAELVQVINTKLDGHT